MARRPSPKPPKHRPTFLRAWREHRGFTQEELAGRIEAVSGRSLSPGMISRLENGRVAYTQPLLEVLAEALGCQPADLLMRDPSRPDAPWELADTLRRMTPEEQQRAAAVVRALHGGAKTGTGG